MTSTRGLLAISLLAGEVEGVVVGSRKELRGSTGELRGSMVEHRGARGSSEGAGESNMGADGRVGL